MSPLKFANFFLESYSTDKEVGTVLLRICSAEKILVGPVNHVSTYIHYRIRWLQERGSQWV